MSVDNHHESHLPVDQVAGELPAHHSSPVANTVNGGLAGGAVGSVVGLIFPVIGSVVGSVIGGALGAGMGALAERHHQ